MFRRSVAQARGVAIVPFDRLAVMKRDEGLVSAGNPSIRQRSRSSISVWSHDDLPGVQVHWFTESTRSLRFYSETYDLVLVREGKSVILSGGKEHAAAPGTVMVLEPRTVFSHVSLPAPETVHVLHIAPEVIDEARTKLRAEARRRKHGEILGDPTIQDSLIQLHASLARDATPLEHQVLFAAILYAFFDDGLPRATPVESRAVQRARDLLHARFREPTTLDHLSRESGISPFYLSRCFRCAFGVAPHTYQTLLRVANARRLLERGVSPGEAAVESGFCDQSHLTRHFQRALGLTPARYARDARASVSVGRV